MSVGDTIQCSNIDELLKMHEELCKDGWDVEFEYQKDGKAELYLKGKVEE